MASNISDLLRSSLVEFRFLGKWLESRMFAMKKSIQTVLLASAIANVAGSTAQAQCLLDIFGWGKSSSTPNPSAPPSYPYSSNYPVVPAGYPIQGQPVVGGMPYSAGYAGIPQSAISLGAPTNYNTSYFPVPTTYYRPVTTTDPRTGQQVTTMMPCTSYQMQALRSPAWSLGQWVHGGNQVPMVPAGPLPAATSSPGLTPPGGTPTALSSGMSNTADPNAVPTLPAINPTLPVYGTQVQSGYGNPNVVANPQNQWGTYNNGVVSANYLPSTAPGTYGNAAPVPNSSGVPTGVYPSDWNVPVNNPTYPNTTAYPNTTVNGVYPNGYAPAAGYSAPATSDTYPSLPADQQYRSAPMFSAQPSGGQAGSVQPGSMQPWDANQPSNSVQPNNAVNDPEANIKPVLPPDDSTSRFQRKPDPSLLSSNGNEGKIQSVVRQPTADMREMSSKSIERVPNTFKDELNLPAPPTLGTDSKPTANGNGTLGPALKPIPLPDGFDAEPQWNPSLLNSSDKTAAVQTLEQAAKKASPAKVTNDDVRWASFAETSSAAKPSESGRRPVMTSTPKSENKSRYDASGWKSAK